MSRSTAASPHGAAFFDLDRTLLAGASGEVFSHAMRAAGLVSRSIPGEKLLYRLFNAVGENLPSMALARQGATLAKGKMQATVQRAAADVAPQLVAMVQPLAASVFAEHRAAGRPIVLATTTPYDLVKPFADLLGLDGVVATRYGVNADGTYDVQDPEGVFFHTALLDSVLYRRYFPLWALGLFETRRLERLREQSDAPRELRPH